MAFQVLRVPTFGGGLDFTKNAAELDPDKWTWANGFHARDGYAEVCVPMITSGFSGYLAGGYVATGIVPNPFTQGTGANPPVFVVASNVGGTAKIYKVNPPSSTVEITPSGSAISGDTNQNSAPSYAFLENNLYITSGWAALGSVTIAEFAPVAGATPNTYTKVTDLAGAAITGGLTATFLTTCRDHLFAAAVDRVGSGLRTALRTVAWSDSLTPGVWDTLMFNSAQFYEITEAPYGITGCARADADTVLVFFPDAIVAFKYTGSNPPFTRTRLINTGQGNISGTIATVGLTGNNFGARGGVAETPLGPVWLSDDNVYLWEGGPKPIGNPIRNYLREKVSRSTRILTPMWHGHWGLLMVPIAIGATNYEVLMWDPLTGAWSRRVLDIASKSPVGQVYVVNPLDTTNGQWAGRWLVAASDGHVIGEDTDLTHAYAGAFVDTKDFAFDDIMADAYIDRIKLDWEGLTNTGTDAIQVSYVARNHYGNILGSTGGEQDETANYTTIGTLTGTAQSELPTRIRAKYVRFRFTQSSGRSRIRGFSIRWQRASDRAA